MTDQVRKRKTREREKKKRKKPKKGGDVTNDGRTVDKRGDRQKDSICLSVYLNYELLHIIGNVIGKKHTTN